MRGKISRTREPLVALRTLVLDVSYSGTSVLGQLKGILVELPAELALIRSKSIFNLGQFGACLLGDFDDVEGWIDVAGNHCLVRS